MITSSFDLKCFRKEMATPFFVIADKIEFGFAKPQLRSCGCSFVASFHETDSAKTSGAKLPNTVVRLTDETDYASNDRTCHM